MFIWLIPKPSAPLYTSHHQTLRSELYRILFSSKHFLSILLLRFLFLPRNKLFLHLLKLQPNQDYKWVNDILKGVKRKKPYFCHKKGNG